MVIGAACFQKCFLAYVCTLDTYYLWVKGFRISNQRGEGLACKAHNTAQRTDSPGEKGRFRRACVDVWMFGRVDVWMSVWRCVRVSVDDITLLRGCLIAGLPLVCTERVEHYYKPIGWYLFHENIAINTINNPHVYVLRL